MSIILPCISSNEDILPSTEVLMSGGAEQTEGMGYCTAAVVIVEEEKVLLGDFLALPFSFLSLLLEEEDLTEETEDGEEGAGANLPELSLKLCLSTSVTGREGGERGKEAEEKEGAEGAKEDSVVPSTGNWRNPSVIVKRVAIQTKQATKTNY